MQRKLRQKSMYTVLGLLLLWVISATGPALIFAGAGDWFSQGLAYEKNKDYDKAIEAFTRAIQGEPGSIGAYNNRGLCYYYKGLYDEAINDFGFVLKRYPDHVSSYNNRALAYDKKALYGQALEDLNRAVAIKPGFFPSYANRGMVYNHMGMYDLAIADCNKALSLDSSCGEVYSTRGDGYKGKKMYEQALADYNQGLRLDGKMADAYRGRGEVYEAMGKGDLAERDRRAAAAIDGSVLVAQPAVSNIAGLKLAETAMEKPAIKPVVAKITWDDFLIVGLKLGMGREEIIARLGSDYRTDEYIMPYFSGGHNLRIIRYHYPGIVISLIDKNNRIEEIRVTDKQFSTARGIFVGDTVDMLQEAYGKEYNVFPAKNGMANYVYMKKASGAGLYFLVDPATRRIVEFDADGWAD